jgi:hypothetical protein
VSSALADSASTTEHHRHAGTLFLSDDLLGWGAPLESPRRLRPWAAPHAPHEHACLVHRFRRVQLPLLLRASGDGAAGAARQRGLACCGCSRLLGLQAVHVRLQAAAPMTWPVHCGCRRTPPVATAQAFTAAGVRIARRGVDALFELC